MSNKNKDMRKLLIFLGIIVAIATLFVRCSLVEEPEYNIEPQLKNIVDKFYQEMELRDIYKSRWNLIVRFGNENHSFKKGMQRIVEIDLNNYHNIYKDQYMIEGIVFHELGHALLNLQHTKDISLMNYEWTYTSYMKIMCTRKLFLDQLILGSQITNDELWSELNSCH